MKLLQQLWLVELVLLSLVQQFILTSLSCERKMFIHSALSVSGSYADVEGTTDSRWCFNLAEKRRKRLSGLRLKQADLYSELQHPNSKWEEDRVECLELAAFGFQHGILLQNRKFKQSHS